MINAGADEPSVPPARQPHARRSPRTAGCCSTARRIREAEHFGETIGSGQTEDFLLAGTTDATHWNPTTNPLPVAPPNYRNVIFKDANTWYSGSPYLGYKGTLPTGTTSQNICGEWYFPLHSHALNEFTNFDAGFGGMGTLLRVDPAGGCFTFPTSTTLASVARSRAASVAALAVDDSTYYQVNPKTTTRTSATTAVQATITVASAAGFPTTGSYYIRIDNEVMQVTGGARHDDLDGVARPARHGGGYPRERRDHQRSRERLVRNVQRCGERLEEPEGDLQGQELRDHHAHHLLRHSGPPAAADRQDLQLDDRRCGGLRNGDLARAG